MPPLSISIRKIDLTVCAQAVREYLEVLRIAIDQQPKSSIVKHCSILSGILVKCFDLRRLRLSSSDTEQRLTEKEVDEIESIIFDTTIALVYKLNDVTFRPMFRKILAWSKHARSDEHSQASIYRQTTFFTFLGVFFGNLKVLNFSPKKPPNPLLISSDEPIPNKSTHTQQSIVTNYAGLIIDEAVQILQSTQTTNATSILLANRVVTALHQSFQHDQDGISPPLLSPFPPPLFPLPPLANPHPRILAIPHSLHAHIHLPSTPPHNHSPYAVPYAVPHNHPRPNRPHHRNRLPHTPKIPQRGPSPTHALTFVHRASRGRDMPTEPHIRAGRRVAGAFTGDVTVCGGTGGR